jgi:hypothetical protein
MTKVRGHFMAITFPFDLYDVARFFSKVDVRDSNRCWNYQGGLSSGGYGTFGAIGEDFYAHRFSYLLFFGKIPDDMLVRHKCDNPACVNPYHLETGTRMDNERDKLIRNRTVKGSKNGNSKLTEEDVYAILADPRPSPAVALEYGVSKHTVLRIRRNQNWKHLARATSDGPST